MIEKIATLIANVVRNKGKVLICGNGGLAAESEHFAAELMGKFSQEIYLPCIALTTNSSLVTAISNDMGFEDVFAHQVRVLGSEHDMLIAMTTSASANICRALQDAWRQRMYTVVICSERAVPYAEVAIQLPGKDVAEVQNEIIKFLHLLAVAAKRKVCDRLNCGEPQR